MYEIAKLFVEAGANVNIQGSEVESALDITVRRDNQVLSEYLRYFGALCNKRIYPSQWQQYYPSALINAVIARTENCVYELKKAGTLDVKFNNLDGRTALHEESRDGNEENVKLLL
jgi:ankyrin repeat protein